MMHVPIRGLFFLGRAAAVAVAVAAVPVIVKASKPLAKRAGEELEKLAKWLQEDSEPKASAAKAAPATKNTGEAATKSAAKKPAPTRRTAKSKPQAKKPPQKGESV